MATGEAGPERLGAFSDGVIAVIITIMMLELRAPHDASLGSLLLFWPTFLSYVLSYFFAAVVGINHHHLLRHTQRSDSAIIWANLLFLFFISRIPFCTEYMAANHLNSFTTAHYSGLFLSVTIAFLFLQRVIFRQQVGEDKLTAMAGAPSRKNCSALTRGVRGEMIRRVNVTLLSETLSVRAINLRFGRSPGGQTIDIAVVHAEGRGDKHCVVNFLVRGSLFAGALPVLRRHVLAAFLHLSGNS
jgi:uncharacterized membrane protein